MAFNQFFDDDSKKTTIGKLFQAKIQQLSMIESELGSSLKSSLATIEPGSLFAMTYVFKFPRSLVNPKKFNIAIEASYSEREKSERHVDGATTSVVISPKPYILSLIAIISAILGVILKVAIDAPKLLGPDFYDRARTTLVGSPGIAAAILALIFFNIYEFTDFGKKFQMGVGWRSALLIGTLCGLAGDRILMALKAFIGT